MVRCFVPRLWTIPRVVRDERNRAGFRVDLSFGNEFCPSAVAPMAEQHSREWPFSLRYDEVRRYGTALGNGVSNIVERAVAEFLDHFVMDVERLFRVVVEDVGDRREIDCGLDFGLSVGQRTAQQQGKNATEATHGYLQHYTGSLSL